MSYKRIFKTLAIISLISLTPLTMGFDLGKELGNILQQAVDQNVKPEVTFIKFDYIGKDTKGVEGRLTFRVKNKVDYDTNNIKYSYKIFVNNNTINGSSDSSFQLKKKEEKTITIPITLSYNHIFGTPEKLIEYLYSQEGSFKFTGMLTFKYDFSVTTAESEHKIQGEFPLDFLDLELKD